MAWAIPNRVKLKFDVNRVDNMIIQAIALLDQLDKDVDLLRIREWYGYHFPELVKLLPDDYEYAPQVAKLIGAKETLTADKLTDLASLLSDDTTRAQNVIDAAANSGSTLSDIDMLNISAFATRVVSIIDYRKSLTPYLAEKMNIVAPSKILPLCLASA